MAVGQKILYGGRVLRQGEVFDESICVRGDRIVAVGERDAISSALEGHVEEIDMEGSFIVPGFVEGHCHLLSLGQHLQSLNLNDCESIAHMQKLVSQKASSQNRQNWILGRGWDQDFFRERRYPTRQDLDEVAPEHPAFLRRACGHAGVANSVALEKAGINENTDDPEGGLIERDRHGVPTGVLHEKAMGLVRDVIPEPSGSQRHHFLKAAVDECLAHGITSAHTNDGANTLPELLDLFRTVCAGDENGIFRTYLDVPYALFDEVLQRGWITGSGDKWVKVGAVKMFADGSLGARSAALSRPYADDSSTRGMWVTPPEQLKSQVLEAHQAGMQVAIHTIGDRALDVALEAVESADRKVPRPNLRHRLVHCQIMRKEQHSRLARSGCVAAIQPKFVTTDMRWVIDRVGDDLAKHSYAWRRLLDEGVPCAGGSDAPVEPVPALLGIWAAVCRTDNNGEPQDGWMPDQKISVLQAIDMFTSGSAYAEFAEEEKGTIQAGALADFACLDKDPTSVEPAQLRNLDVVETWVGGRPVYTKR